MSSRSVLGDDMRETEFGPTLVGGRCDACDAVAFPRQNSCARCSGVEISEYSLKREGTLWSFTIQGFRPKDPYDGPKEFEPYGVGYVDLEGELLVEARLTLADPAQLKIGMPLVLVTQSYTHDPDRTAVQTFAFAPKDAES